MVFRRDTFFPDPTRSCCQEIAWQATHPDKQDWSDSAKILAFFLNGSTIEQERDDDFFVMLNCCDRQRNFEVPNLDSDRRWLRIIDTANPSPDDIIEEEQGTPLTGKSVPVAPMAAVVLISKPTN